ncbi:MAG: helix-turn-helix domain-containing protein [Deltaproteobacteria bacterium]|nr:helix-turn-helix domain-containing protein [Deltaproteobacteria bacterium]
MESLQSQSVAIDGLSVRKIREEKRLTQLYVAKVVGVTTDTVSRWENNRYPTIRRDNALKLAESLEVELEEILKKESSLDVSLDDISSGTTVKKNLVYLLVLGTVVLAVSLFLLQQYSSPAVPVLQARRIVPEYAAPGSRILIQVQIVSEKPLKGMILKEKFPAGWRLIESEPVASSVETRAAGARWIFRSPAQAFNVYYLLEVALENPADTELKIVGEVIANPDGQHSAVALETTGRLQVKPLHWADSNGNRIIDDLEILAVSEITEKSGDLNLEWDLIEQLWEAGGYQWQPEKKTFLPFPGALE